MATLPTAPVAGISSLPVPAAPVAPTQRAKRGQQQAADRQTATSKTRAKRRRVDPVTSSPVDGRSSTQGSVHGSSQLLASLPSFIDHEETVDLHGEPRSPTPPPPVPRSATPSDMSPQSLSVPLEPQTVMPPHTLTLVPTPARDQSVPDISLLPDMPLPSFHMPETVTEPDTDTLEVPSGAIQQEMPDVTYTIVDGVSKRSKSKLVDSLNYGYNKKCVLKRSGETVWLCCVRNKETYCSATVKQLGDIFTRGPKPHVCTPKSSALEAAIIRQDIITKSTNNMFTSGSNIVNGAIQLHLDPSAQTEALPQHASLVRLANKRRQGDRPPNPTTLDFDVQENAVAPGFIQADIRQGSKRHFLLFTATFLSLLRTAMEWYVDATFKAVGAPFTQLWGIHAFLKHGDSMKQVPLTFALMSGKSTSDYVSVLEKVILHLQPNLAVVSVVLDFEASLWAALRQTLPNVQLRGCHFHWTQAIWRKVQELGLAVSYQKDAKTQKFIRRLFCLPFLPAEHIKPVFDTILALDCPATPMPTPLRQLLDYMNNTWILSTIWPPTSWSVFNRSIRTNNDCEGWHRRLNTKTLRHNLPFYQLLDLLHKEASLVDIQSQFINDDKLKRDQRERYKAQQGKIFTLWENFTDNNLDARELLRDMSKVYRPVTRL